MISQYDYIYIALTVLAILSRYKFYNYYKFIKILPVVYLIIILLFNTTGIVTNFLFIGLFLCGIGDVLLANEKDTFLYGLLSFLIAHVFYIIAFLSVSKIHLNYFLFILPLISIVLLYGFRAKLKKHFIPISFYLLVLNLLHFSGYSFSYTINDFSAFYGVIIFILSDLILAFDRFVFKIKFAQLMILSFYFLAQYLIVKGLVV
ncbi:MAG: lysoplasmalogenase [Melioribacteraceae bacterium]|nr:lysoplasmalogenase [Melioribacteraceae bacterium]MCF8411842.1 lysoplasmalogenase [Melioribacteraceae bacterium]MCF8431803.1 lysoplasmalogenase [Melioribacteraceae bacterium]